MLFTARHDCSEEFHGESDKISSRAEDRYTTHFRSASKHTRSPQHRLPECMSSKIFPFSTVLPLAWVVLYNIAIPYVSHDSCLADVHHTWQLFQLPRVRQVALEFHSPLLLGARQMILSRLPFQIRDPGKKRTIRKEHYQP
nr:hypothetical protein CFP56_76047 [Quercus suber]